MPQSQTAANTQHQEEEKRDKNINTQIWRVTFLKSFLPLNYSGIDFQFSMNNRNIKCALIQDEL